jgi:hypothetical protein
MHTIQSLTVENVRSVYSGKTGKCFCGCSGNHWYRSDLREEAGKDRGYAIGDDEVSDREVLRVLRMVQAHEDTAAVEEGRGGSALVAVEIGKRTYVVYLRAGVSVAAAA